MRAVEAELGISLLFCYILLFVMQGLSLQHVVLSKSVSMSFSSFLWMTSEVTSIGSVSSLNQNLAFYLSVKKL